MIESLRLYALCKAMKWTHLPVSGGLYDQHPHLLDDWYIISGIEAAQLRKEAAEKEAKRPKPSGYGRRKGR